MSAAARRASKRCGAALAGARGAGAAALYGCFWARCRRSTPGICSAAAPPPGRRRHAARGGLFIALAVASSVTLGAARIEGAAPHPAGHRRTPFGRDFIKLLVGNPVMPLVTIVAVAAFVVGVFSYYGENNRGVEFFVDTEPEQGIVYVRARGNLSLAEKDALVREAEAIVLGPRASRRSLPSPAKAG
jgi:multidrug efflux pump